MRNAGLSFEFIDDIAIADAAFRARGATLEEVFRAAAAAVMNVMVEDLASIRPHDTRAIELQSATEEMLLFDFLQEIIFYKDVESLLLLPGRLEIAEQRGEQRLRASLSGEAVDPERHPLGVDVKAVTMHHFSLRRAPEGWQAEVIVDV